MVGLVAYGYTKFSDNECLEGIQDCGPAKFLNIYVNLFVHAYFEINLGLLEGSLNQVGTFLTCRN